MVLMTVKNPALVSSLFVEQDTGSVGLDETGEETRKKITAYLKILGRIVV